MKYNKKNIFSFFFIAICLFFFITPVFSANFPLEIINIKPAGTGAPAIPSTNRIFRAYPGIEYNIRAGVIGGVYPYTYSMSNAPTGMVINRNTGEISWPNPQNNSGPITLSVTDQENITATATWSITVNTSGFIFVDDSYAGTEAGTINQPYRSLINMLNGASNTTDIIYFRSGNYQLEPFSSTNNLTTNIINAPFTWLGYPGETVTINGNAGRIRSHYVYFDKLNITDLTDYGITLISGANYNTIRRCTWSNLVAVRSSNNNQGFIFTWNENGDGYYLTVQDNSFSHWAGASAIGSLYYTKKALIENNHLFDNDGGGMNGINNGISPKYGTDYLTVRGNKVEMNSGALIGGMNAAFVGSDDVEICFNLFMAPNRGGAFFDYEIGQQGRTWVWRNTFIGDLSFRSFTAGPYYVYNNIISNPNTSFDVFIMEDFLSHPRNFTLSQIDLTQTNNLKGLPAENIVDNDGLLTSKYSSYIGTRGWQFVDGSTPMDGTYTPPFQLPPTPQTPPAPGDVRIE